MNNRASILYDAYVYRSLPWLGDEIGRLARLKILWEQSRVGSIPTRATNFFHQKVKLKTLLTSILLIFIFSCSSAPSRMIHNTEPIKEFLSDTPYTHFISACRAYDLNGSLAAFADGDSCIIEPDGSYYRRTEDALDYTTADQRILWRNPVKFSHHQIFRSNVSGNFLAINNEFKNWNGKLTRFDVLLLLNQQGRIVSRFSFYDFFKKHPQILKQSAAGNINWSHWHVGNENDLHELTHTNSFIELTRKSEDGKQFVTGYLSNCTFQNHFMIFDPALKNVIKVINLNNRSTHSVTQIDNDRLLFYRNSAPGNLLSSAEVYNIATNEFTTIYKSNNTYLSGAACSSVQLLSPGKLMLAHSQCIKSDNKADYGLLVEFVDLNKKESFYYPLYMKVPYSNTYLIDGVKFVETRRKL